MLEYNHKGERCMYKDIICQESFCCRCNIAIENRKCDITLYLRRQNEIR